MLQALAHLFNRIYIRAIFSCEIASANIVPVRHEIGQVCLQHVCIENAVIQKLIRKLPKYCLIIHSRPSLLKTPVDEGENLLLHIIAQHVLRHIKPAVIDDAAILYRAFELDLINVKFFSGQCFVVSAHTLHIQCRFQTVSLWKMLHKDCLIRRYIHLNRWNLRGSEFSFSRSLSFCRAPVASIERKQFCYCCAESIVLIFVASAKSVVSKQSVSCSFSFINIVRI